MRILLIYGEVLIESKSNREKNYMRKNISEIERKIIKLYEKSLYYQHTLKLLVLESSLVILACTVSSPTFCVVGLCLQDFNF